MTKKENFYGKGKSILAAGTTMGEKMEKYTLFCYDSSVDMFCEYTSKTCLKDLKRLVADARNDHSLYCRMYISDGKRIVKKYDAVTDEF